MTQSSSPDSRAGLEGPVSPEPLVGTGRRHRPLEADRKVLLVGALVPVTWVTLVVLAWEEGSILAAAAAALAATGSLFVAVVLALRTKASAARDPAEHLDLAVSPERRRRGDSVTAVLTITDLAKVRRHDVEVGLVCTEWYDEEVDRVMDLGPLGDDFLPIPSVGADDRGARQRVTREAIAYEEWVRVERTRRAQTVTFPVPLEAPYSHQGDCLSFAWRVEARQSDGPDRVTSVPIWVAP